MAKTNIRYYNCKDGELTMICSFVAGSLESSKTEFSAYSPKFNDAYLARFVADTEKAMEVNLPQTEIQLRKVCTATLYGTLDSLKDPINRLKGYLKLAYPELKISAADFGLRHLRKCVSSRDTEGAIQDLHLVIENIENYKASLILQGLSEALITLFISAHASLIADKRTQSRMLSNRRILTQSNLLLFNTLYRQLTEILLVGKILYKITDPATASQYTFTDLKKRVHRSSKHVRTKASDTKKEENPESN